MSQQERATLEELQARLDTLEKELGAPASPDFVKSQGELQQALALQRPKVEAAETELKSQLAHLRLRDEAHLAVLSRSNPGGGINAGLVIGIAGSLLLSASMFTVDPETAMAIGTLAALLADFLAQRYI